MRPCWASSRSSTAAAAETNVGMLGLQGVNQRLQLGRGQFTLAVLVQRDRAEAAAVEQQFYAGRQWRAIFAIGGGGQTDFTLQRRPGPGRPGQQQRHRIFAQAVGLIAGGAAGIGVVAGTHPVAMFETVHGPGGAGEQRQQEDFFHSFSRGLGKGLRRPL